VDNGAGVRCYRPKDLDKDTRRPGATHRDSIQQRLVMNGGAAVAGPNAIALAPGLEVRLYLRNERTVPAKPCAGLVVQEES
jgi:hypothetical protein